MMTLISPKEYSQDWTSGNIEVWKKHLHSFQLTPLKILEIGSFEGRSAVFFLEYLQKSQITCIDTFDGSDEHNDPTSKFYTDVRSLEQRFDHNVKPYAHRVEKLKGRSTEVLAELGRSEQIFDLIYIDGDHSSRGVLTDATQCWGLLRQGGIIIFDDYQWEPQLPASFRPQAGIDAFLKSIGDEYTLLHQGYQIIIQRRSGVHGSRALTVGGNAVPLVELPLVSFVIVNWNYAQYVGQTIDSIAAQDYQNFECIVIDNGSEDESRDVIARHIGHDPRFKMIPLPSNLGQLGGAFVGLKEAQGSFVVIVDSDDVLFPNFTASHVQAHLAAPENVAITTSNVIEVDGKGRALTSQYSETSQTRSQGVVGLRPKEATARLSVILDEDYKNLSAASRTLGYNLSGWLWAPGTSNMMRASALRPFLRNDGESYLRSADNYLLPLCHATGGTLVIDVALSAYRIHGKNYHTALESLRGVSTANPNMRALHTEHYLQNVEFLLSDPALRLDHMGPRYWKTLDRVGFGLLNHRNAAYYALFVKYAQPLREVTGDREFLRNIAARFGFLQTVQIIIASNKNSLPIGLLCRVTALRLRRRKFRRLRKEVL